MARKKTSEPKKADETRSGHVVVKAPSKKLVVREKKEEKIETVEAEIVSESGAVRGGVGGNGNLIPFNQRTKEEQREICTVGGVASGKSRREKKAIRDFLNDFLDQEAMPILKGNMQKLGVMPEDMTNAAALLMSLFSKAVNHADINAFRTLMEYAGRAPLQEMRENEAIAKMSQAMQLAAQNGSGADDDDSIEDVVFYIPDNGRPIITDEIIELEAAGVSADGGD